MAQPRVYADNTEPVMVTIREVGGKSNIKFIWWYIAKAKNGASRGKGEKFAAQFFNTEDAMELLTFQNDGEFLGRSINLVESQSKKS